MTFLLYRDTGMGLLKGQQRLHSRARQHVGKLHISAVTIMQIELWLLHRNTPGRVLNAFGAFLQSVNVVSVDDGVAHQAARIGSRLRSRKVPFQSIVLLVAATALVHKFTLVTHSPQAFANVPGLTLADWFVP